MQAETEVGAPDHARVVFRFEPARTQVDPTRGKPGKPPFELGAAGAVARDEDDQIREPAACARRLPAPNPFLAPRNGVHDQAEVFVFGPARGADDESRGASGHAQPREQRLAKPLPLTALHRHETGRWTVVQDPRVLHSGSTFEKRG